MKVFNYPKWLQAIYPGSVWGFSVKTTKVLYLTFDDGPHPEITPWILEQLDKFDAKATFFCVGENAKRHPELIQRIKENGHEVGNHTMNHINGFKTSKTAYLDNVNAAAEHIPSKLFRPPYGKLGLRQYNLLKQNGYQTVFWSFLSYDFDQNILPEEILYHAKNDLKSGNIIVCHDSEKAFSNLEIILPELLEYYTKKGFTFSAL